MKSKRVKRLEMEIMELEEKLRVERNKTRVSAFVTEAELPKCKSLACVNCEHLAYIDFPQRGIAVLGCGKEQRCPDYSPRSYLSRKDLEELRSNLLSQELS